MADEKMTVSEGSYRLQIVPTNAAQTRILTTENKFVDKNIVISVPGATGATGPILNIADSTAVVSVGTVSGGYYPLTNSLTGQTTYTTGGWITTEGLGNATDAEVVVGKIAQSTLKNGTTTISSGSTVIPSTTASQTINIGAGYEAARTVVIAPMSSGTSAAAAVTGSKAATTPTLADETTSLDGKTRITVTPTTASTGISKYYLSVKTEAPATNFVASNLTKTINTAGYLSTTAQISIVDNAIKTTAASRLYYIPIDTASATVSITKAAVAPTASGSTATLSGKTSLGNISPVTASTGINTYYIPFQVQAPATTFAAGDINKTVTSNGFLSTVDQISVTGNTSSSSATYYMPVASGALQAGNGSVSSNGTPGGVVITEASSAPATGYYIRIDGYGAVSVGTEGWLPTTASTTSNTATKYIKLNTAEISACATNGVITVGEGYVPSGSITATFPSGSISSGTATKGWTANNTSVPSGGYLYLAAGYYGNTEISLDSILGGSADTAATTDAHILQGYAAYDVDGQLLTGTIATYDGSYTFS